MPPSSPSRPPRPPCSHRPPRRPPDTSPIDIGSLSPWGNSFLWAVNNRNEAIGWSELAVVLSLASVIPAPAQAQ